MYKLNNGYTDMKRRRMKKINIDGLLLCLKCENQLRVDGPDEFGFFRVYPCTHCTAEQGTTLGEDEPLCLCPLRFGDCECYNGGKCDSPLI